MSNTLIRLKSETEDGIFDCNFQDEIILEPNSEIALQSVLIPTLDKTFELDVLNGLFQIFTDVQQNEKIEIAIPHGHYNKDNFFNSLLPSIEDTGNFELSCFTPSQIGSQFRARVNTDSLVFMEIQQAPFQEFCTAPLDTDKFIFGQHLTVDQGTLDLINTQPDGSGNLSRSSVFMLHPFGVGGASYRATIDTLTNTTHNHRVTGYIGLVKHSNIRKILTNNFKESDFEYAIKIPIHHLLPLKVLVPSSNGNFVDSEDENGQPVLLENVAGFGGINRPIIEIGLHRGRVFLSCYQGLQGERQDLTGFLDGEPTYFPLELDNYVCVAINTSPNTGADQLRMTDVIATPNPFTLDLNYTYTPSPSNTTVILPSTPPRVYNIIFENTQFARFLGFENSNLNPNGDVSQDDMFFEGKRNIPDPNSVLTHLIELLDFPLKTYDSTGLNGSRRNILASIPILADSDGVVSYEPNEKYYIRIDNTQRMSFRNIRARIVNSDFFAIETEGDSFINILVRKVQN